MTAKIEMTFGFKNAKHLKKMIDSFMVVTGNDTPLLIDIYISGDFIFDTTSIENELRLYDNKVTKVGNKKVEVYIPEENRKFKLIRKFPYDKYCKVRLVAPNFNGINFRH